MRERFVRYLNTEDERDRNEKRAGFNLSWGAIFAGILTFLALYIVLSTLGSAIGLGAIDLMSSNPLNNMGTGAIVWMIITMLISFFGAGFVAGIAARRVGLLHGFVTWAGGLVILTILMVYMIASLLSAAGSAVSTAGEAVASGADAASDAIVEGGDQIAGAIDGIDMQGAQEDVREILADTGVEELQPEYLESHMDGAGNDIMAAGRELLLNPENSEQILNDLQNQLAARAQDVESAVDEDAISNSVARNTDLNEQEAEEATQNIVQGVEQAEQEAQNALNEAENQLHDLRQDLDEATDISAWALFGLFIGLLLMAVVASLGGLMGSNLVKNSPREHEV
ncbi:TIGR04086 family membrane protein [Salinicoccus halitifaciens]|uniref:Small secreted protein n=1 Tax=Salinicoccus halitifaciens TaxID=1073415 RepID=A0ABV2E6F8_9STAP|nr:TIGR04086 family membrane protein [Salinicoccus halitifaciens]MCD2137046.1 hypothetical protein [Salinicoccus halitifaciens]